MRAEKQLITKEYVSRLNASPFFMVVDYRGLTVGQFTELRKRLVKSGSEVHVVKCSIFRSAAKETGFPGLAAGPAGRLAAGTGHRDVWAAAQPRKTSHSAAGRPTPKFGSL